VTTGTSVIAIAASVAFWTGLDTSALNFDARLLVQPWRLVSSTLLHVNVLHLAFNLFWLWSFGTVLEQALGSWRYLLLIVTFGVLASSAEHALLIGGVGLSGVVYGLLGFLWTARSDPRFRPLVRPSTVHLFVLWFFVCVFLTVRGIWEVGNVAHGAGAVAGLMLGRLRLASGWRRRAWLAATIGLTALSLAGATVLRPAVSFSAARAAATDTYFGHRALSAGHHRQAVILLASAVLLDDGPAERWFLFGVALHHIGAAELAGDAYGEAATRQPDNARYRRAAVEMARFLARWAQQEGRGEDAARFTRRADELDRPAARSE
jgi:GlpG protein